MAPCLLLALEFNLSCTVNLMKFSIVVWIFASFPLTVKVAVYFYRSFFGRRQFAYQKKETDSSSDVLFDQQGFLSIEQKY